MGHRDNHKRLCPYRKSDVEFSGIPCVSKSPFGKQDGLKGKCITSWAAWAALRLADHNKITIVECSDRLKNEEIGHVFENEFVVLADIIDSEDIGWLGRRIHFWGAWLSLSVFIEACCTIHQAVRLFPTCLQHCMARVTYRMPVF